jgi:hypothetical protein
LIQVKVAVVAFGVLLVAVVVAGIVVAETIREQLRDESPEAAATPASDRTHRSQTASPSSSGESPGNDEPAGASDQPYTPRPVVTEAVLVSPLIECGVELGIGEFIPVYALGEVAGMGPSARYVAFTGCPGPAVFEAIHGGAPSAEEIVVEGGCSYGLSSLLTLIKPVPAKPDWFQAAFRASPTDYLGVAEDAVNRVVTGGYSVGGDGTRGSGQQWSISGGRLTYRGESSSPLSVPGADAQVRVYFVELTWEWSGESIENWTREEAVGKVRIACGSYWRLDRS